MTIRQADGIWMCQAFAYAFNGKLNVQVFSKGKDRWDIALKQ